MLITIAICTRNRAESLRRTLGSLVAMRVPDDFGSSEILVINNDCTDHTDDVLDLFADRLPIRREYEPERGVARARNKAVLAAKGEFILWTDDDVIVDPGWLAAYLDAFRRYPGGAVFGGKIVERYLPPSPKWITTFEGFATRDFGPHEMPLSVKTLPFTANCAINTVAHRYFPYDPMLGPGTGMLGEETDVITRMLKAGAPGYWIPSAVVEHMIPPERQTRRAVLEHFAALGAGEEYLARRDQAGLSRVAR